MNCCYCPMLWNKLTSFHSEIPFIFIGISEHWLGKMVEEKESLKEDSHGPPKDNVEDNPMDLEDHLLEARIVWPFLTTSITTESSSMTLDANIQNRLFANNLWFMKIFIQFKSFRFFAENISIVSRYSLVVMGIYLMYLKISKYILRNYPP